MMFRDDYKSLFDSVSPPLTLELQTEREINEMLHPKSKKNLRRTACIVVALIIATLGAALAAVHSSGILDRLFLYYGPSETARQSVIRDSVAVSENGVTLNMDEYLFDRNTLHLGWTVSSEREKPVYYTTAYDYSYTSPDDLTIEEESVGGFYGASGSGEVGNNVMVRLAADRPAYSGSADFSYCAPLNSTVNAHVVVHVYETDCEEVSLPGVYSYWDIVEDEALWKELEGKCRIGYTENGDTNIQSYAAFNEALQRLEASGMDWDAANEAAIAESGFFRELCVLELNVAVDPHLAAEPRFRLEGERSFELSDASVILKQLVIDTASTMAEYEVITEKEFAEANTIGNGITYILFDQNGHPLNADCSLSMSAGQLNDRDGKYVWLVSLSGNPIPEPVTSITFVPTQDIARMENEASNAYFIRMKEAAAPGQCFTIDLN